MKNLAKTFGKSGLISQMVKPLIKHQVNKSKQTLWSQNNRPNNEKKSLGKGMGMVNEWNKRVCVSEFSHSLQTFIFHVRIAEPLRHVFMHNFIVE